MKPVLLALALLTLPLVAHAGDPDADPITGDPIFGSTEKLQPALPSYTIIPLSEIRVISMKEMMNQGGISLMGDLGKGKKKKKRKLAIPGEALALAGMSAAYDAPRTWDGGGGVSLATLGRTPALDLSPTMPTVTRAAGVAAPEPGAAFLVFLALPVVFYLTKTRSKNA
jgi:hypothetical protein